jgi:hypothetical protein
MSAIIITNLLTNMVVLTFREAIPTNTSEFQNYASREIFAQASNLVMAWNLELPRPIVTNLVTDFRAEAYPAGLGGNIVLNQRYFFSWVYGGLPNFNDQLYSCLRTQTSNVGTNDAILEEWMQATNLLTLEQAEAIAENAIRAVGVPVDKLDFFRPKEAYQFKCKREDGEIRPLPYYQFYWRTDKAACTVDVSGINGKVVYFSFAGTNLWFKKPANYYEMLGLPPKPVFVKKRFTPPGMPCEYELLEPSQR